MRRRPLLAVSLLLGFGALPATAIRSSGALKPRDPIDLLYAGNHVVERVSSPGRFIQVRNTQFRTESRKYA